MMQISVVIPTRDRPRPLARCLAALADQQSCGDYEVIVVDDGSSRSEVIEGIVAAEPRARLVRAAGCGAAAARNAGARVASGSVLLFTDDDCVPAPGWAEGLARALTLCADVAGGRTENGVPGDPFVAASEAIREHLEQWSRERPHPPFIASNNLAVRRALVLQMPFDEAFAGAGGEDRDWCARAAAGGARFARAHEAVVTHVPVIGLVSFWRQHVRYGRGAYRFGGSRASGGRLQTPSFYTGLVRRGFADGVLPGLLVTLAQVATSAGYVQEAAALRFR